MDLTNNIPIESVKIIAESIGIPTLSDDVGKEISDDITFRLKNIIQDCSKFMIHGKRRKICVTDFDNALQIKNIEPLYGILPKEHLPFRFASGGGRELHFIEDRELDITDMLSSPIPKFPLQISLKPHWLAIEGVQPSIPENPAPLTKVDQKKEAVDPAVRLTFQKDKRDDKHIHGRGMKSIESVKVKQLATHELSAEQQLYYKEITEACVGSDEPKRGEALQSLAFDPGLYQMVPRLCTFIGEGVRVNIVQKNLALLIYLMRMAKALLDNQSLYLEKYLHELVPPVMSCIVSRQLCLKPELDNHWALRDFAARLASQISKNYNTTTNVLQIRMTRVFSKCLTTEGSPLSSVYGAIAGLTELGTEVSKVFVLPKVRSLSDEIERCVESGSTYEKNAASHIKSLLLKTVAPILKTTKSPPDVVQEYRDEFGYLGTQLQAAVVKLRQVVTSAPSPPVSSMSSPAPVRSLTPTTRIVQQSGAIGQRTFVVNKQASTVSQQPLGQKLIIMTSKSTPSNQGSVQSSANPSIPTLTLPGGGSEAGPQKYLLLSGASSTPPIKQEIKEEPMEILSPQHDIDIL